MGDPAGIGPEVTIKALSALAPISQKCVVIGSRSLLTTLPPLPPFVDFVDAYTLSNEFEIGAPSKESGMAAYAYLENALDLIQEGDTLVTAPLSKLAFSLAKIPFTGHTTYLKGKTGADAVSMGFTTPELSVVLSTIHIPLKSVVSHLDLSTLRQSTQHAMALCQLVSPEKVNFKVALAGLNPHAGENGLFGDEEETLLKPMVKRLQNEGYPIEGPFPADTVFWQCRKGVFDIVIALYHDQGLIAVKTLAFDQAVNISLGLPFIRTSPDHGTAYDIAGQNIASSGAMEEAIKLALKSMQ